MAKNGFQVMDSDMHIIEPADLWERYMAPEFRGRVTGLTRYERDLGVALDGENLSAPPPTHPLSMAGNARERAAQNAKYQDGMPTGGTRIPKSGPWTQRALTSLCSIPAAPCSPWPMTAWTR